MAAPQRKVWHPHLRTRLAIVALYAVGLMQGFTAPGFAEPFLGGKADAVSAVSLAVRLASWSLGAFVVWKALAGRPWARTVTLIYCVAAVLAVVVLVAAWDVSPVSVFDLLSGLLAAVTFWLTKRDKVFVQPHN